MLPPNPTNRRRVPLLPFLLFFMMRIANDRRIMGRYVNNRWFNALGWGTVVTVTGLTLLLFVLQGVQAVTG